MKLCTLHILCQEILCTQGSASLEGMPQVLCTWRIFGDYVHTHESLRDYHQIVPYLLQNFEVIHKQSVEIPNQTPLHIIKSTSVRVGGMGGNTPINFEQRIESTQF